MHLPTTTRPLTPHEQHFYSTLADHYRHLVTIRPDCLKTKRTLKIREDILRNGVTVVEID